MKQSIKRCFALILSMAMALSLCVNPALAAELTPVESTVNASSELAPQAVTDAGADGEEGVEYGNGGSSDAGNSGEEGDSSDAGDSGEEGDSSDAGDSGEEGDSSDAGDSGEEGDGEGNGGNYAVGDVIASGECGDNLRWEVTVKEKNALTMGYGDDVWTGDALTMTIRGNGDMYDYDCDDWVWDDELQYDVKNENNNPNPWVREHVSTDRIVDIVFDGNITHIGAHTFRNFNNLKSVVIPSSVKTIGAKAFAYCNSGYWKKDTEEWIITDGLHDVTIPSSVTFIDDRAFEGERFPPDGSL